MEPSQYVLAAFALCITYVFYVIVWRLYWSPIAKFPGPKLAALTHLYEAYYNNWCGGRYIYRIQEMHDRYGPIVRISPSDLHVGDPDFYEILYPTTGRRANKSPSLTKFFGLDDSLFSTVEHDVHKLRRAALLPYFSTSYMRRAQPYFQERLDVMLARIAAFKDTGKPINVNCMYAAFSNDMVHTLAFGNCQHKLETPTFDSSERDASLNGAQSFHILKRFPRMNNIMMAMPEFIANVLNPTLCSFMRQKRETKDEVQHLSEQDASEFEIEPIFKGVLESSKLPAHERSVERVAQDAQMLKMAGTLTMASTLEHLTWWMLDNPHVLRKLKDELKTVMPSTEDVGKLPLTTLESLPYLTAVIKESVRLIYGNSTPHFRYDPDSAIRYEDKAKGIAWVIPAGTNVGMSSVLLHHNETKFPDSHKFVPERWLGEEGKRLDKYNVGFGKGARVCIGMNQAYGTLRLALSQIWRLYASPTVAIGDEIGVMSLYNTTKADVEMTGDFFVAAYRKKAGVEVTVASR